MKPVYQTLLAPPDGNCFAACVASILELPIESVPNFQGDEWWDSWQAWLYPRNLAFDNWAHKTDDPGFAQWWIPKGYSILSTLPPGASWQHATVALDGSPIWNPYPGYGDRIGEIGAWQDWIVFRVLDPRKPVALDV